MWGSLVVRVLTRPWARHLTVYALTALTITLFILNLRRTAERAGRTAQRLENLERTHAIQHQMLEAAALRPRSRDDLLDRMRQGGF